MQRFFYNTFFISNFLILIFHYKSDAQIIVPIALLQGKTFESIYNGKSVTTEGVVTGDFQLVGQLKGFYIQSVQPDTLEETSEGIFVYDNLKGKDVKPGEVVRVSGEVDEYYGNTEIKNVTSIHVLDSNKIISPLIIQMPLSNPDDWEKYEGMLVYFPQILMVTDNYNLGRYGELLLSFGGRLFQPTNFLDPNITEISIQQKLNLCRSILLDDGSTAQNPSAVPYLDSIHKTIRTGSTVSGLTGLVHFTAGSYRVHPSSKPKFNYASRPLMQNKEETEIRVASFNLLNYFNGDGRGGGFPTLRGADTQGEFLRQRAKIIQALKEMDADILGLVEIENDGDGNYSSIADLVKVLNTAYGAEAYRFIEDPQGKDGNSGRDAIKVAMVYKPEKLQTEGNSKSDTNIVFSRAPLAQTFTSISSKEKFSIVVNHFKSKSCSDAKGQDQDQQDGQSCYNDRRKKQAFQLLNFIKSIQTSSGDEDVLIIGDLNSYEKEDPIKILHTGGFNNLIQEDYSYVFEGQSGALDHALGSLSILPYVTSAFHWHINADEPAVLDYNLENKSSSLYEANPYRSSDHDPVILGLNFVGFSKIEEKEFKERYFRIDPIIYGSYKDCIFLRYELKIPMEVELKIFNCLGQEIKKAVKDFQQAGKYEIVWNYEDNSGQEMLPGYYLVKYVLKDNYGVEYFYTQKLFLY